MMVFGASSLLSASLIRKIASGIAKAIETPLERKEVEMEKNSIHELDRRTSENETHKAQRKEIFRLSRITHDQVWWL